MMSTPELASRNPIGHASADAHAVHSDQEQAHSRGGAMPRGGCCASVSAHQHEGGRDTRFRAGGVTSLFTCRDTNPRPFLAIFKAARAGVSSARPSRNLRFNLEHQAIQHVSDALHVSRRLSFRRSHSGSTVIQKGLTWNARIVCIRSKK
jgi:hypothetical protein